MSESNPRKRLLTQQEINLAQNTIGNAIDWSKVQHGDKRYAPLLPQYRRLLIPFFQQPHNRQLLPIYS